ncbi:DUF4236 domain-containing protein [Rhodococcus sp. IEGM 1366]|uniref:DUF4236 domain-containing protein n=1 Tax=Rhodococcus sp. IEGM 1366 TaxID=3082223 RepID=UPI0039893427
MRESSTARHEAGRNNAMPSVAAPEPSAHRLVESSSPHRIRTVGADHGFHDSHKHPNNPRSRVIGSRSAIGYSAGAKGARITKHANGRVSRTLSVPGTGLSHQSTIGATDPDSLRGTAIPREIIAHSVWPYYRITLSLRDVEESMLAHRRLARDDPHMDRQVRTRIRAWPAPRYCPPQRHMISRRGVRQDQPHPALPVLFQLPHTRNLLCARPARVRVMARRRAFTAVHHGFLSTRGITSRLLMQRGRTRIVSPA